MKIYTLVAKYKGLTQAFAESTILGNITLLKRILEEDGTYDLHVEEYDDGVPEDEADPYDYDEMNSGCIYEIAQQASWLLGSLKEAKAEIEKLKNNNR